MTEYTLPDLPYDYGALEPHLSARILELHHGKHHDAYVTGANKVQQQLAEARASNDYDAINQLQKNLAFHLSGHVLHSLFWKNMSPDGGGEPDGDLGAAIGQYFGDFEAFRARRSSSSRCTTTRATSGRADRRSSCSTCGSTRTTCSTRTGRPSG